MARVRVVTASDPDRLLRHAASGFLIPRAATASIPYPTVEYLLCLRQGGLRDDVIRLAGEAGVRGWFDTPLCVFQELPERLGVKTRSVLSVYERQVILTEILRTQAPPAFSRSSFAPDIVSAIDSLLAELISAGIEPDALKRAFDMRSDRDAFDEGRDADLLAVYRAYQDTLARSGRTDGRDALVDAARAIAGGSAKLANALRGRRQIRIFGLADMRGGWLHLLKALSQSPDLDDISIYTSTPLDLEDIDVERESLDEPPTIAALLFRRTDGEARDESAGQAPPLDVARIIAPDVKRELENVAVRIRTLIDNGVAPHRIAVVTRQARPHVDQAIKALASFGVPATARQRSALREAPVIRALSAVFAAANEGWTRHGLTHLSRSPYVACDIDARIVDLIGYRRRITGLSAWSRAIGELERDAHTRESALLQDRDTNDETSAGMSHIWQPSAEAAAKARGSFDHFASLAIGLDTPKSLDDWLQWTEDFLSGDGWGVASRIRELVSERYSVLRRDIATTTLFLEIIRGWRGALGSFGADESKIPVSEFARWLGGCLDDDVILWSPSEHGIQVLEATAAAYRSFDHVFMIGMQAGAFPSSRPRSPIWDEIDRDALRAAGLSSLDTGDMWEAREQDLFRVIVAGARNSLTISHARLDATGRDVICSAFVDELRDVAPLSETDIPVSDVVTKRLALYRTGDSLARAIHAARMESARASASHATASPYNGRITDEALLQWLAEEFGDKRLWSPTQLEEFAKCPWAYLSKRLLRLERYEDPDEDLRPSLRGKILHDALSRFYTVATRRSSPERPVFLLPDDWSWAAPMLDSALAESLDAERENWLGHPALHDAKRAELTRTLGAFIQWEMALHHDMTDPKTKKRNAPRMVRTGVTGHEIKFDEVVFERDGVSIRYRGSVDRIEQSVDERAPDVKFIAAADYKSTKYSTPGGGDAKAWTDGVVLQVPLYAYALSKMYPKHQISRVEYLTLARPASVHSLQLYEIDKKTSTVEQDDEAIAKWHAALGAAIAHVKQARRGEFPAAPPESCGCPPWCHGRDVCRVPRGAEDR